jgi:hypothetical protein
VDFADSKVYIALSSIKERFCQQKQAAKSVAKPAAKAKKQYQQAQLRRTTAPRASKYPGE